MTLTEIAPRPSVLLVGNFLSQGGLSRGVCEDLAEHLRSAGWRVLCTSSVRPKLRRMADMVATAWRARRDYQLAQVDVYSGPAFLWAEAACWTLRRAGKPYVLTLHGGRLPEFAAAWPRRVRRLLRSAAAVTAPSGFLGRSMQPYHPRIRLLPNPIDVARYPFRLRGVPRARLVWLRAFHALYRPALAVEVLSRLLPQFPGAELTMIGPDKADGSLAEVERLAARAGLAGRVHLLGPVPKTDVGRHLARADVFLNTTTADNTPVSVLEAMACGLCVVSTEVGGMRQLVSDGRSGLLVPADDPVAMTAAVHRVLTEPGLGARLSDGAHAAAVDRDWSIVLPQWEELFCEALGRAPGHPGCKAAETER